ncbi:MAG TPA: penicillin acylase family protein [Candidatus Dormibacteraeota bacterium]|nr:penicillin acylase family protein [Candidatus Dormibacteraeota bacterium]
MCRTAQRLYVTASLLAGVVFVAGLDVCTGQTGSGGSPDPAKTVTIPTCPDCAAHAVIRRDQYGVPHILADTEEAAAYAQGYATAEDHGALLARAFLRARGQLASVFGAAYVHEDVHSRTLRIYDTAAERFGDLPPFMQAIVNGYAAGFNAYLASHRTEFPAWATLITGVDVVAHARTVLLLDFALDPRPWEESEHGGASNMWVIGPAVSATHHAMLLANPHLSWNSETPPLQEVQLTVPGVINVSGAAFVGTPIVAMGFNDSLGWTHTVNRFSSDDVYELTLDSSGKKYKYDGQWLPLIPHSMSIPVREGEQMRSEEHTAFWSHYGPIIRIDGNKAYAYRSPNLNLVNFLTEYNEMGKASSINAFRAALDMQQIPMFNIGYADKAGNIWYVFNARIPIRPPGFNWPGPVAGDTSKSEWFAVWPMTALPQLANPKSGYLQNCNDAPWYTNLEQPIDRSRFDGYLNTDDITWRGMLSLTILSAAKGMTLENLMAYKYNSELIIADRLKGELVSKLRAAGNQFGEGIDVLERWDNSTHASSQGAVLFLAWWDEYSNSTPQPFRVPFDSTDPIHTPAGIGDPERAVDAFRKAVVTVKEKYGHLDITWGEVHRARRGGLDLPVGGSDFTFERMAYRPDKDGKEVATAGDAYALAVEFGEAPSAYSVLPYSEASQQSSPYYNNQLPIYAHEKFKPDWFTERDILSHLDRAYRPQPSDAGGR